MERILQLMKDKGITKAALSEKLGIRNQNFNSMLKNPTYETLNKIAAALEVPMWQLFASPEEVKQEGNYWICPKCHTKFELKEVEIEKKE